MIITTLVKVIIDITSEGVMYMILTLVTVGITVNLGFLLKTVNLEVTLSFKF